MKYSKKNYASTNTRALKHFMHGFDRFRSLVSENVAYFLVLKFIYRDKKFYPLHYSKSYRADLIRHASTLTGYMICCLKVSILPDTVCNLIRKNPLISSKSKSDESLRFLPEKGLLLPFLQLISDQTKQMTVQKLPCANVWVRDSSWKGQFYVACK